MRRPGDDAPRGLGIERDLGVGTLDPPARLGTLDPPARLGTLDPHWDLGPLDPDLRAAADLLSRSTTRYQPSFRFQEALAARLRGFEAGLSATITMLPVVEPLPLPIGASAGRNRSLLVGGAIASGVSLAGAIVAWRLGRLRQNVHGSSAEAVISRIVGERA